MVFDEGSVLRSPSLSHLDDPGAEELNGFVDDYDSNYSTSLVRLHSRKDRRWWWNGKFLIMVMAVLALVGVCVGLGIVFSDDIAASALSTSNSGDGNQAASAASHKIPQVPSDLHVVCAPMNIQSDKGYNDCLELCQPAQCCEFAAEKDISCVEEHRNTCEKYRASCQHLDHKKATDTDVTVDKACAADSLMTVDGVKACKDTCEAFKCCFDGSTDCDVSEALCSDNGACATAVLVDSDGFASHAEAKQMIEFACGDLSTSEGQTQCTNVCNPGVCCFLSEAAWTHPCTTNCQNYESCSALYGSLLRDGNATVDQEPVFSIPQQVETACNPASLASLAGVRECFDLCQHHLCCFDGIEAGGCPDTNPDECHLYSACRAMVETEDNQEQPQEICAANLVELQGPEKCMQACRKGYCCLMNSRFESSCASDQICGNYYQGCQILAPEKPQEEDADLVKSINTVCTESNLASVLGATECERDCSQRGCCIETGAGNCKTSDLKYCIEVDSCQLLFTVDPTPEVDDDQDEEDDNILDAVTQKLQSICMEDNFSTLSGYHNCYDQCFYHLCCFSGDPEINCKDQREEECAAFAPCETLMDTSGNHTDALGDVCSSSSVETMAGLEECRKECAPKLCCFQDPNLPSSCIGWYGKQECKKYDACKILVSDASHSVYNQEDPYLVGLINNYCKAEKLSDEEDARSCMAHCEKRSCCFNEGECWETNHNWCNEIIACANHPLIVAHTGDGGSDVGASSEDVDGDDDEPEPDEEDDIDVVGDDKLQGDSSETVSSGEDVDGDGDEPEPDEEDNVDVVGDDKLQGDSSETVSSGEDVDGDGDEPEPDEEDNVDVVGDDKLQGDSSGTGSSGEGSDDEDEPEADEEDSLDFFGDNTPQDDSSGPGPSGDGDEDEPEPDDGDDKPNGSGSGDGGGDDEKPKEEDSLDFFGDGKPQGNASGGGSKGEGNKDAAGGDKEPDEEDDLDLFGGGTTRGQANLDSGTGGHDEE